MRIVVRGIFILNKSILLAKYGNKSNYFLPGGGVEVGELIHEALKREIFEEMGLKCQIKNFICTFKNSWKEKEYFFEEKNYIYTINMLNLCCTDFSSREPKLVFEWHKLDSVSKKNIKPEFLKKILQTL